MEWLGKVEGGGGLGGKGVGEWEGEGDDGNEEGVSGFGKEDERI